MPDRIELSASAKGSLGEDEDWWKLVVDDDGKMYVEHEWSHRNAYKFRVTDGSEEWSAYTFMITTNFTRREVRELQKWLDESDHVCQTETHPMRKLPSRKYGDGTSFDVIPADYAWWRETMKFRARRQPAYQKFVRDQFMADAKQSDRLVLIDVQRKGNELVGK